MPASLLIQNYVAPNNLFLRNCFYDTATYTNSTGSSVTLAEGTLLGRVQSSNKVLPCASAATDGSQQPMGILVGSYTVANTASATVTFCNRGEINKSAVVLNGSDTWATAVGSATTGAGSTLQDLLIKNTGISLVNNTELANYDNQ